MRTVVLSTISVTKSLKSNLEDGFVVSNSSCGNGCGGNCGGGSGHCGGSGCGTGGGHCGGRGCGGG